MKCLLPRCSRARAVTLCWLLAGAVLMPRAVHADCRFRSVGDVSFGAYDVFSALPNRAGVASLRISCQGVGHSAEVTLSTGLSHHYSTRTMRNGNEVLEYNLYTNASRTVVWGDGSGGSRTMDASKNQSTDLTIYGSIPAGQDPAVGSYADSIVIGVEF